MKKLIGNFILSVLILLTTQNLALANYSSHCPTVCRVVWPGEALRSDPFLGSFELQPYATSAGVVGLPLLVADADTFSITFSVDPERAALLLPEGIEPVVEADGSAQASITVFRYNEATLDPYQEAAVHIKSLANGRLVNYVVALPVTTEQSRAIGIELWALPKYIRSVRYEIDDFGGRKVRIGRRGVAITIPSMAGTTIEAVPFDVFASQANDGNVILLGSAIPGDATLNFATGVTVDFNIKHWDYTPFARALKTLQLTGTQVALFGISAEGFSIVFQAPENL